MSDNENNEYNPTILDNEDSTDDMDSNESTSEAKPRVKKGRKQRKPKKEASVALPNMLLLGYQEGTSRKDLEVFINSKANELMNVDAAHFNMIRKHGGYYWELQEGGSGHGVLSSVIDELERKDEVFVQTSSRTVKVIKKRNGDGIDAFMINEEDCPEPSKSIVYRDKMKHVNSKGTGFMIFGIILALLGVFSFFLSFVFKYGLLNKMEDVNLSEIEGKVPYTQFDQMKKVLDLKTTYVDVLTYNPKTDTYLIKTGEEELPDIAVDKIDNAAPSLPQEIIDATSEVVTTGKEQ